MRGGPFPGDGRTENGRWDVDEAEGVVAFASEWLELDASDDWVRHDSETVCCSAFVRV